MIPGGPGTPCPSDCWDFDKTTGACSVKAGTTGCFELTCSHDKIRLVFQSKMYNVKDTDANSIFGTTDLPTFSDPEGWVKECKLGECGMTAKAESG